MPKDSLVRVPAICGALPETTERLSHGAPTVVARLDADVDD